MNMNAEHIEGAPWALGAWARALLALPLQRVHLFRPHLGGSPERLEEAASPRRDGPLTAPADGVLVIGRRGARGRRVLRLAAAVRRHQNALLTIVIALGIVLMIIHWSGSGQAAPGRRGSSRPAPEDSRRSEAPLHRESRPGVPAAPAPVADEAPPEQERSTSVRAPPGAFMVLPAP